MTDGRPSFSPSHCCPRSCPRGHACVTQINTCSHLALLSDIVCHKRFLGERLPGNLSFVAAVNPYRLRRGAPAGAAGAEVGFEPPTHAEARRCSKLL